MNPLIIRLLRDMAPDLKGTLKTLLWLSPVLHIPPELLRKGRFDEYFFVDLPTPAERGEIAAIHLARRKRDPADFDLRAVVQATEGFNGAEIEALRKWAAGNCRPAAMTAETVGQVDEGDTASRRGRILDL